MTGVCKFVPKLLTMNRKQFCMEVSWDMLGFPNGNLDVQNVVITDGESLFGYNPETKLQSSQKKHSSSPRPKTARHVLSKVRAVLTLFFDSVGWGIMSTHNKVKHENNNMRVYYNIQYYLEVSRRLRDVVR